MSAIVFEKGIVTCTFLVTLDDRSLNRLQYETLAQVPAQKLDPLWSGQAIAAEVPGIHNDPIFWSQAAVDQLFQDILARTRPQGVVVATVFAGEEADTPHVAALRQRIARGEKSGQLVTKRLQITRPDRLPFPGVSWLTSQIRDEPGNGLELLYLSVAQVPA